MLAFPPPLFLDHSWAKIVWGIYSYRWITVVFLYSRLATFLSLFALISYNISHFCDVCNFCFPCHPKVATTCDKNFWYIFILFPGPNLDWSNWCRYPFLCDSHICVCVFCVCINCSKNEIDSFMPCLRKFQTWIFIKPLSLILEMTFSFIWNC